MMKSRPTASRVRRTISTGKRMRLLERAAPLVVAVVGLRRDELVDEVALGAHDLDAVVAGALRERRARARSRRSCCRTPQRVSRARVNGLIGDRDGDGATASG